VSRTLSSWQAFFLGLVVLGCTGAGGWALYHIGQRQGLFAETFDLTVYAPDAQDVDPGTPVRIRGVEAGQVVAVEFAEDGGEEPMIRLRLKLAKKYQDRLFADATATIASKGLLGTGVVNIHPGKPKAGPLSAGIIRAKAGPDMAEVTAKLAVVADRADAVLKEVQESQGTLVKLLKDDNLYEEFHGLAKDARTAVQNANAGIVAVQGDLAGLKDFVRSGKDAAASLKQDADAIKSMPIIRSYVEDPVGKLVRPNATRERQFFNEEHLFQPGTAVLTDQGKELLAHTANWLNGNKDKKSDVVVVSFADPRNPYLTAASAKKLTEKQAEVVAEYLKEHGVHKVSFWSRRKVTALGYGFDPSPVVEREALPPTHTQVLLFVPQS
jgi:phospholipid/cholesterol/gamma-HCH transport system substrate-binding protein